MNMSFDPAWLSDPEVFAVNRLPACSDHEIFRDAEELRSGKSSLVRSLNGAWRAHYAICPADAPDALLTDGAGDDALAEITVPCEFQLTNPDWDPPHYVNVQYPWDGREDLVPPQVSETYNPTVTAVRRFTLTEADCRCGRMVLTFEGVEAAVAVYMNGVFIGYSEDSFTPHRFDVTDAVHPGENRLAARIFKRCTGSWMEDQDFWRFSGIHRSVTLTMEPAVHLADVFVHTPLTDNYTRATVDAELKLDRPAGQVTVTLTAPDGAVIGEQTLTAAAELTVSFPVDAPRLWSAETPELYTLTAALTVDGQTVEVGRVVTGIREFCLRDGLMQINGKRIVFHGVNRHEFHCDTGRVMDTDTMLRDIRDMKAMNVNAVRTCHYPDCTEFYRLCDRYGLYIIDETNIETHGSWTPMHDWFVPGSKPEWREMTLSRGRSMLERDKNHPCVIMWSCGNESWGGTNLLALHDMFRSLDSSRPVHYEGVWSIPEFAGTTDVYSRMYHKVADIEEYLRSDPEKPFMNCEYTHAMGNSCGGITLYTELEDKYPKYQGGFIWDYVDQALRVKGPNGATRLSYGGDWGDRPTDYLFNTNGIILGDRTLTPKVQEIRYAFQYARLTPDEKGVAIQNRRLFTDLSDLVLTWEILRDGQVYAEGSLPCPAIQPGETARVEIPWTLPADGEVTAVCRLVTDVHPILPKGTIQALGCTVLAAGKPDIPAGPAPRTVVGDVNVGVFSDKLNAQFIRSSAMGKGLSSLKDRAGKECLLHTPLLSLMRAPTDNDRGNGSHQRWGIWDAVSRWCTVSDPEIEVKDDATTLTYRYTTPLLPGKEITLRCETAADEAIRFTLDFPALNDLPAEMQIPDLPALGLAFRLDRRLTHVTYRGLGPEENYADRCQGAMPGVWHYEADDGWTRYARPQESGNRMGVTTLTVLDDDGHGVRIDAEDAPLECSVQPWLPEELASKWHPDELQGAYETVLDVAAFRCGVGGDDSWGAPILPQYTYPTDKPYRLRFLIRSV